MNVFAYRLLLVSAPHPHGSKPALVHSPTPHAQGTEAGCLCTDELGDAALGEELHERAGRGHSLLASEPVKEPLRNLSFNREVQT